MEISSSLRGLTLRLEHNSTAEAEISIYVNEIDVDAGVLATLEAHLRRSAVHESAVRELQNEDDEHEATS